MNFVQLPQTLVPRVLQAVILGLSTDASTGIVGNLPVNDRVVDYSLVVRCAVIGDCDV